MAAALQTLSKFKRIADSHKVDEIIAGATSATREADNGGDFIAAVDRLTGIKIRIISGTEEARLIHLAAGYGVDVGSSTACVVDIGGGSVEVTLGTASQMTLGRSFKTGVIRLTERFVKSDPLSDAVTSGGLSSMSTGRWANTWRKWPQRGFDRLIGTSGTILSLGALALSEDGTEASELRNRRVERKGPPPPAQADYRIGPRGTAPACPAWIRAAPTSASPESCFSTPSSGGSGPRSSRSATSRCAKGSSSITSTRTRTKIRKAERYPDVRRRSIIELGRTLRLLA